MMGAHQVQFDNDPLKISWKMGVCALMNIVEFGYNPGKDLFSLRFRRYATELSIIDQEKEYFGIYDDMVIPIILKQTGSRQTGFYLRL